MRRKYQLTRGRVQLQNRLESLLEETQIKLSSLVSDLLGVSGRRISRALAEGYYDPTALAALADRHLRATGEQLRDALEPATELNAVYRRLLKMVLEELEMIERQMAQMEQEMAMLLSPYQGTVQQLAEVPGLGVDSAQQIVAEVGIDAATFPSAKKLASWVGICPGTEESAGISRSHRCPNGNRYMRRILNQCALASIRVKGSIFQLLYRRLVPRLGHKQAIGAVAHRLCRLIWMVLHRGVRYLEMGSIINLRARQQRAQKMIRELRSLGYRVEPTTKPM
jgi:transposase